jgi:hypothetical protein
MIHPSIIEARLGELRFRNSRWFTAEVRELQHILHDNEKIIALACGRYFGSFALLVATDQRLLLIDKRVFFMNYEDTRYDMISEIDFNWQFYSATLTVFTVNKTHKFTSIKYRNELRQLTNYVQKRVFELRSQMADSGQNQTNQPLPPRRQAPQPPAYQTALAAEPAPANFAARPTDYYVDDKPDDNHHIRERVGHIAHVVGSAATNAAHHHAPVRRPFNPYVQGSLMTRRPIGGSYAQPEPLDH